MELKTAIEILDYHQEWRLGKREDMIYETKKLTEAIDIVLREIKKLLVHDVKEQRELLIAYENKVGSMDKDEAIKFVDEYLSKKSN